MSSFTVSFLKLLRNSTAMTLLFLPAVSAMEGEWENWDHLELSYSSSASSSIGFEQIEEERRATGLRSVSGFGEPDKLFLFENRPFIKGEVPGDGTCFLHTLNILFPDKGISRDMFATLLKSAFHGENTSVSTAELREEFAVELYTQLNQRKVQRGEGAPLEFEGEEINKLSIHLLNETAHDYFDLPENSISTRKIIAANDKIIEEMLECFSKTHVMLSLPALELKNIGSFGLACKLFDINLDVYAPLYESPHRLYQRAKFRFGDASLPPKAAFYAHAHVSPLCFEEDLETRKRFAENEIKVIEWMCEMSSQDFSEFASRFDSLSFTKSEVDFFGQIYTIGRFNINNTDQYKINMPQAPVVHTYSMDEKVRKSYGTPVFSYAACQRAGELDANLFPALSEAQATLQKLGIDPKVVDYFYVVQDNPWTSEAARLLRPQSWAFPGAPYSSDKAYDDQAVIEVAILSPDNSITLTGPSKGLISSHNGINPKTLTGNPVVVSSGGSFPMLSELKADQTSFFVSTVVIPSTKRAAITFHTILSDDDFALLQTIRINNLSDLQSWIASLFQRKYGATSDGSSPYSNWTTRAVPIASISSMDRSYEEYFRGEFLQKMGDSFREYNRSTLSNDAILKALFPSLPEGEVPPLEVAKAKFSELAKGGRPYAKLFTPPESVGSSSMDRSYEDYFRGDFLQKMGDSFREYNRSTLSNGAILKVLFPSLREGQIPDREAAKAKFSELAKGERPYAKLFMPPLSYEEYFRGDFLQRMGDSFRGYNNSTLSDDAILKVLFPSLREGQIPDRETAKAKFSELAKGGRPYALLFNPPEE
ncbi:MAG: hypothetical protein K2X28_08045 [Alphaproteobacteria bacterium]|nr:hypothetical protein [Alphaproteobacteria bacterium]